MAKLWTDILVPLAITGIVAAQTLGVEISRAARLHAWFPGAQRDTLVQQDTLPPRDSLPVSPPDSWQRKRNSSCLGKTKGQTLPPRSLPGTP